MNPALVNTLQSKLDGFAKTSQRPILCEGIAESVATLRSPQSVEQDLKNKARSLQELADYFDCDVAEKDGCILLNRRYTDKSEFLTATYQEVKHLLTVSLQIIGNNVPNFKAQYGRGLFPVEVGIHQIFAGFTRSQREQMYSSAGLQTSGLSPQQVRSVTSVLAYQYLHELQQALEQDINSVRSLSTAVLVANTSTNPRTRMGLNVPGAVGRAAFRPIDVGRNGSMSGPGALKTPIVAPGLPTLGGLIGSLNKATSGAPLYQVEGDLAAKPIMVAGLSAVRPAQVVRGLCALYNLTPAYGDDGSTRIGLKKGRRVPVEKLRDELVAALPPSIHQCLLRTEPISGIPPRAWARIPVNMRPINYPNSEKNMDTLCGALSYRLHQSRIAHLARGEKETKTPVSQLSEWERASLAVILCRHSLGVLGLRAQRVPPYIANPRQLRLTASSYNGPKGERLTLTFGYFNAQNQQWSNSLMISDVDPPKP